MRNLTKLGLLIIAALPATGCFVAGDPSPYHDGGGGHPAPTPTPALDAARPLGAAQLLGYRVESGAAAELPAGDLGFVITANGQGGYRVTWSDTYGSAAGFFGTLTTHGHFRVLPGGGYSGARGIHISGDHGGLTLSSAPGSYLHGGGPV